MLLCFMRSSFALADIVPKRILFALCTEAALEQDVFFHQQPTVRPKTKTTDLGSVCS